VKAQNLLLLGLAGFVAYTLLSKPVTGSADYGTGGGGIDTATTATPGISPPALLRDAPVPVTSTTPSTPTTPSTTRTVTIRSPAEGVAAINAAVSRGERLVSQGATLKRITAPVDVKLPSGKTIRTQGGTVSRLGDGSVKFIGIVPRK